MTYVLKCRRLRIKKSLYFILLFTTLLEMNEIRELLKYDETKEFIQESNSTHKPVIRPTLQIKTSTKYKRNFENADRNFENTDRIVTTKGPFGNKVKTILLWNDHDFFTKDSKDVFRKLNCDYSSCFLTTNRTHLPSVAEFDAILFNINGNFLNDLPKERSKKQKYIAMSREPPTLFKYNKLFRVLNDFFNLTFTYKLDSDITFRYYIIYDKRDRDIAPAKNVRWLKSFKPTAGRIKRFLRLKTKAVAWVVSHCNTASYRELYVQELSEAMSKLNLSLDIYGACGKPCKNCKETIGWNYRFYLAFEKTQHIDYVTEKILNAVLHHTVPIVKGGADYSRFLPPGSYIDANKLSPGELAKKIESIMSNTTAYEDYFRWTNHYVFKHGLYPELCSLCKTLNNDTVMNTDTVYGKISQILVDRTKEG